MQKDGNAPDEYEDAAYPLTFDDSSEQVEFRCAVADGATETSFSGLWANLLVRGFVDKEPVNDSRKKWQEAIPSTDLPWYAEEKAQSGAFAALVGLSVNADKSWHAEAIGDSCLLHIRDEKILQSFPLKSAEEFNNRPALICSIESATGEIETAKSNGNWQDGDTFLLLSDAVARWTLDESEGALNRLCTLENADELHALATEQRALQGDDGRARLHNDDITIMKVQIN